MKNKLLIGLFAFFSVLNFTACDTEPIDPNIIVPDPVDPVEDGTFTAKIDGVQYTALTAEAFISGGAITIAAVRANGDNFAFVIGGNTAGTYAANQNILMFTQGQSESGWQSINPANPGENTGSVTISEVNTTNHTITGTFHFTGYWNGDGTIEPKEFTEGEFTVPYSDPSVNPNENTFTATIDGSPFNPTTINAQEASNGGISIISITALDQNGTMSVMLSSDVTVGNHPIATGTVITDDVQVMYLTVGGSGGPAVSGNVNITQKTADHVKGTFTATIETASGNIQVTQGNFDVTY
ncbi:hypothetical protein HUK80_03960 [Flavobacterium sp. MAH-1]|uniref:Lipoprotein n=1 Tax=Flavobacterium agri TaxID=2743471 RepID=A0A7Y8Y1E0_9FLAO|nr:DUF6252 family protein [Flavobacterium agri]NUY80038.1 hypothetical protein [Flavobacterium agri]NYA70063.1 hypothetical protein [Flavobacterium agri]